MLAVGKAGADPAGARDVADRARGWVRPWAGGSRAAEGRGWVAVAAGLAALLVAAVLPALALLVGAVWAGGAVTARAEAGLTDTARLFVGSFDQDYRAARLTVVTAVTRPGIRLALAHGDVGLARATLANMAATAPLADAGLYDARGRQTTVDVPRDDGEHGGGDGRLLERLFGATRQADPLSHMAGSRAGALSALIGIAANASMLAGQPIAIADLLDSSRQTAH